VGVGVGVGVGSGVVGLAVAVAVDAEGVGSTTSPVSVGDAATGCASSPPAALSASLVTTPIRANSTAVATVNTPTAVASWPAGEVGSDILDMAAIVTAPAR
jgi:hypothetical protein